MSLVPLLVTLLVLCAVFYLIATYVPAPFKAILLIVLGVIALIWAVNSMGILVR